MTRQEINKLLDCGEFPERTEQRELIETHISWVILCDAFVYKIKKPMKYSFLNFTTPELRKYYCEREIKLNKRLTDNVYLEVLPIREDGKKINLGGDTGNEIDYAVKMIKLDGEKQMDRLLAANKVKPADIENLADKIASFHKSTTVIREKDALAIQDEFNDLKSERDYASVQSGKEYVEMIDRAIAFSDKFIKLHSDLVAARLKNGFYRDCHGDLHSRNIFLLPEPVPFDCIEFNDDFRQIDVLNEIAFLCMDLDAAGRDDFSELFLESYNRHFTAMSTPDERMLFVYYKAYRANIRAKVSSLRARSAATDSEKLTALSSAEKYLSLMNGYIEELEMN
ncbi:phosphotransferase [Cryomorpha ignava]|uniref:Phosphotransferase n=1 Tax=Cryomorpha ignava TaxID=101383 RepID=A0A7K3WW67_9FLAO|nr:phosphotransferase [Cryomorpha ignava]NEN25798.1 phosphotransferase [Cryomorpha ignava]